MKTIKSFTYKLLFLTFLFSINTYAQDEPKTEKVNATVVYNDVKEVAKTLHNDAKEFAPKITSTIESLAKGLKTTADQLWTILVRQQKVWSIVYLILTISALFNWFLFYRRNVTISNPKYEKVLVTKEKLMHKEGTTEDDARSYSHLAAKYMRVQDEELAIIPSTTIPWFKYLHLIICLTLSIFSFIHFSDMLTGFINPEYGALKTIVEVATQLK